MESRIQNCRAQDIVTIVFLATDIPVISGDQHVLTYPDFVYTLKIFTILQSHLRSQLVDFFLAESMIRVSLELLEVKGILFEWSNVLHQFADHMNIPWLTAKSCAAPDAEIQILST